MKRRFLIKTWSGVFLFSLVLSAGSGSLFARTYQLHAFKNYGSSNMQKMELIGQVTSRSHMITGSRRRMLGYDTREMIISASLYENVGVRIGDTIHIIQKDPDHNRYKNGLIVGEAVIYSVFQTEFQGWMIKARGNLSMVKKGHFIARLDFGYERQKALEFLKKGEKFHVLKDYTQAYYWYKKSLDMDDQRPETYMKLARLASDQELPVQASTYIHAAWKLNTKVQDPNDMLKLPSLYLKARQKEIAAFGKTRQQIKGYLTLLSQIRDYTSMMGEMKAQLSLAHRRMLEKRGIPHYEYQFQLASLYENIYHIMKDAGLERLLGWLSKEERKVLLSEIKLPYRKKTFEHPEKSWYEAYFESALHHFQLANELNELDTRASYKIITMAGEKLNERPSEKKRDIYLALLRHYGRVYLRVPDDSLRHAQVRRLLNRYIQL